MSTCNHTFHRLGGIDDCPVCNPASPSDKGKTYDWTDVKTPASQSPRARKDADPMIKVCKILSRTKLVRTCMEWQGSYFRKYNGRQDFWQYPEINYLGRRWRGNRLIWTLLRGPISKGYGILHRCNNPRCLYIGHLYLGNQTQNNLDCIKAGRENTIRGKDGRFNKKA